MHGKLIQILRNVYSFGNDKVTSEDIEKIYSFVNYVTRSVSFVSEEVYIF